MRVYALALLRPYAIEKGALKGYYEDTAGFTTIDDKQLILFKTPEVRDKVFELLNKDIEDPKNFVVDYVLETFEIR